MIGKILAPLSLKKGFFCETTRMSIVTAVEVGETEPIFFCFLEICAYFSKCTCSIIGLKYGLILQ